MRIHPRLQHLAVFFVLLFSACQPAPSAGGDLAEARQALVAYFELLSQGEYAEALQYFTPEGDFYDTMRANNPEIDPDDYAALLENACTFQLMCLEVKQVVSEESLSDTEFQFTVEFANADGTTFVLGPCCGANETDTPPQSQFTYIIIKTEGGYRVLGGPVYVP